MFLGIVGVIIFVLVSLILSIFISITYRRVVPTNMVHIVQSSKTTKPFGSNLPDGNVYYEWPSWLPIWGVNVIKLPVSNFDLSLKDYEAYDKDRVPFKIDVTAFFRIKDTRLAAQRISSVDELRKQLGLIVQGAVRKVLASDVIDNIMIQRAKFGSEFSDEIKDQLDEWGCESVKSMELMDIRDHHDSHVIANIMAKKISHIEMESRIEVASNNKNASNAEIEAKKEVTLRVQETEQEIGQRTAAKEQAIGVAKQISQQEILEKEKDTKTKQMEVRKVETVRTAEIEKEKEIIFAQQEQQKQIIKAEADATALQTNVEANAKALQTKTAADANALKTNAEARLFSEVKSAEGIKALGISKADAEKAMQMAPVEAQIMLAKEIGENENYQKYLISLKTIEAYNVVGKEQATALKEANIKIIANAGNPVSGMNNVMDIFSSKGGTSLASMIEALAQSPVVGDIMKAKGVDIE